MAEVLMRYRKASAPLWLRQYRSEKVRHRVSKDVVKGMSQRPKINRPKTTANGDSHLERQELADGTVWNIVHQRHTLPRPPRPVMTKEVASTNDRSTTTGSAARAPQLSVRPRSPEDLANDGFIVYRIQSSAPAAFRCSSLSEGSAVSSNKSNYEAVHSNRWMTTNDGDPAIDIEALPSVHVQASTWVCESARISYTDNHVSVIKLG